MMGNYASDWIIKDKEFTFRFGKWDFVVHHKASVPQGKLKTLIAETTLNVDRHRTVNAGEVYSPLGGYEYRFNTWKTNEPQ